MRHFLEEYGAIMVAVVLAVVVVSVIMVFLPELKNYFNHFVTQMMQ